jgi:7-cyano-7-deazaguanine synthase in queuosine biosynthesis
MKILVKNGNPYLAINVEYGQKCNTFTNFTKKLSKVLAFISNLLYVRCYILNIHLACTKGKEAINGKKTILNHKKKIMLHQ